MTKQKKTLQTPETGNPLSNNPKGNLELILELRIKIILPRGWFSRDETSILMCPLYSVFGSKVYSLSHSGLSFIPAQRVFTTFHSLELFLVIFPDREDSVFTKHSH
jgi:hypothetical protein